jgi:hypothetical protein
LTPSAPAFAAFTTVFCAASKIVRLAMCDFLQHSNPTACPRRRRTVREPMPQGTLVDGNYARPDALVPRSGDVR